VSLPAVLSGLPLLQLRGANPCGYYHYCRQADGTMEDKKGLGALGMLFYPLAPDSFENRSTPLHAYKQEKRKRML